MKWHSNSRSGLKGQQAFTLIELLVVIAIIAILAGITFPVFKGVMLKRAKAGVKAQLTEIETHILEYYADYNSYPLDNTNNNAIHPLYYELVGTTYVPGAGPGFPRYDTATENITEAAVRTEFNQDGLRNVTHDPNDPGAPKSKNYFPKLNSDRVRNLDTGVRLLRVLVKDVDANMLTDASGYLFNPVRYVSTSPTNSQGRFDLWAEFEVGGVRVRVSNWENNPVTLERPAQ
jgi:prepilin-type N-terminal cleavage/methylation domain-containing protein